MGPWFRSRKGVVLALQWLLVVVVAVWGATSGAWRTSPTMFWALVALSAVGNAGLMRMPLPYFYQPIHWMHIFIADTAFVGAAIYCMVGFDSEFYLPYFLIILVAALTRSVARAIGVAVGVSAVYMFLLHQEGASPGLFDTAFLIRLPFFIVLALFTSYLANAARLQQEAEQSSLALADQVRSLQQLAAGIAHEVRNPLTAINNSLEVILNRLSEDSENRTVVRDAMAQVGRVRRIVQETLEVARPAELKAGWVDLNAQLEQAVGDATKAAGGAAIEVRRRYSPRPPMVWGDAMLIGQALGNVVRNAIEAMPDGGTLELETRAQTDRGRDVVVAHVRDTGGGFPAHQLDRLYQPFYTTKPNGTGLGLVLARKFVRSHGGDVEIASAPSGGTEVRLALPVSGPSAAPAAAESRRAGTPPRPVSA